MLSTTLITHISWQEIQQIWREKLWPKRNSAIDPNSAMVFNQPGQYEIGNMHTVPTFFGIWLNDEIVGVNSGHGCVDGTYRSRGLWVNPDYRKQGLGTSLLTATIEQARREGCHLCWSFPRRSSWSTYSAAGFHLVSEWEASETSDANAYCAINL